MITRIELTNFMSHKHTVIEPAAGLTVLVGPNNIGKSAVVAALQILCHNDASTHVIRHGERECLIHVETDDGHTIDWRRKSSPSYVVNGQQFDRLGRSGVPDELHKALRLSKADGGADADFDIHFGTQKSPIFLLASTPANAAKFFASSSDAIRLVEIQKRHKDKHDDAKREKKSLEAESRQVNAELAELEPVVEVDDRLTVLEAIYGELLAASAWLEAAEQHAAALEANAVAVAEQSLLCDTFAGLSAPPQLVLTEPLVQQIRALEVAARAQAVAEWRAAGLAQVPAPPEMQDADCLGTLIASLERLTADVQRGAAEQGALGALAGPPQLADTETLARSLERLVDARALLATAQAEQAALKALARPPEIVDVSQLVKQLSDHARLAMQVTDCQSQTKALAQLNAVPLAAQTSALADSIERFDRTAASLVDLADKVAVAHAELNTAADELRAAAAGARCGECGAELDPEQVIARATAGLGGHDHG